MQQHEKILAQTCPGFLKEITFGGSSLFDAHKLHLTAIKTESLAMSLYSRVQINIAAIFRNAAVILFTIASLSDVANSAPLRSICGISDIGFHLKTEGTAGLPSNQGVKTLIVHSTAQLLKALNSVNGGEILMLTPGTYAGVVISNVNPSAPIIIESSDIRHAALLVGLGIDNSSKLKLYSLELTSKGSLDKYFAFRIANSSELSLVSLDFHGDYYYQPALQLSGLYISRSRSILIEKSNFHQLNTAVIANNNDNIKFLGNKFYDLNKGAIGMGGSSFVDVEDNYFTNFRVSRGTHPDLVQIYTANTDVVAHDINISGNIYIRGEGNAAQGIFIKDEKGDLPVTNLTVSENLILGGMWNSIYLNHVSGVVNILGNTVASWAGIDMPGTGTVEAAKSKATSTDFRAFIALSGNLDDARITESNNAAQSYMRQSRSENPPPSNRLLSSTENCGTELLNEWSRMHENQMQ